MKNKIAKLIDVKSISTLSMVATFVFLAVTGAIPPDKFLTIFTVVVSFYYGTQYQKNVEKSVKTVESQRNVID